MEIVYRGFDGLDVAFKAKIPTALAVELESAKEFSAEQRQETLITFGGVRMKVADTGAKGGYAFRCDTGKLGAIWFFKKPNKNDPWGIRVSVKSLPLAVHGLGWVRNYLYETLHSLGIATTDHGVSVSRIDYAIDILAPEFVLDANNFVMHARCNRKKHDEITEISENGHSGRTTSVTIGKNPGRQIIIYDKREEVISKRKVEWTELWNQNRRKQGLSELDFNNPSESRIWRVELRAYKRHLKNTWGVTLWSELDDKLGDVYAKMVADIRYADPISDTNRARWPNAQIWKIACKEIKEDLFEMRSGADPDRIKEVIRDEQRRVLQVQKLGLGISLAALDGIAPEDFEAHLEEAAHISFTLSKSNKVPIEERIANARSKYIFLKQGNSTEI